MEPKSKPFKITMPILKAYQDEDGNVYIRGLGGDAEADYDSKVDRTERLSKACIEDLKRQVAEIDIPLVPAHWEAGGHVIRRKPDWRDKLGRVTSLIVNPYGQMFPLIKLDMDIGDSRTLYRQIKSGKQMGLSWGGLTKEWHLEHDELGNEVLVIDKLELWHFAVTTRPVNSRTLNFPLQIVAKSIDYTGAESVKIDSATLQVEYSERKEVLEMFKSFKDAGKSGYEGNEETKDSLKEDSMTPEEIKKMMEGVAASVKAAVEPLQVEIAAIKTAQVAPVVKPEPAPAPAAKSEGLTAEQVTEIVTATLKSELDARELAAKPTVSVKSKEEISDEIKTAVNAAMENIAKGLKSKPDGGGDPNADPKTDPMAEALKQLASGEKTIDDFDGSLKRDLEDYGESVFKMQLTGMKSEFPEA